MKCAEFAMLAEGHRRAGMLDQAEQMVRSGLDEHPDCAEGALVLALVLLDQGRPDEARRLIESWADTHLGVEVTDHSTSGAAFDAGVEVTDQPASGESFGVEVSDGELDVAFESAETDRDEVIDADAIAQHAMSEVDGDLADEFASPEASYATRTVANLLSQQGDEKRASRIRAMMESQTSDAAAKPRNRRTREIEQLERWLANIRGGIQ